MEYINLPLLLVVLTLVGVAIYVYDWILLRPERRRIEADLRQKFPAWKQKRSDDHKSYTEALDGLAPKPWWVRETHSLLPIVVFVLVLRSFIVEPFQIPSSSMEPTLDVGDFILVDKFSYGLRLPVTNTEILATGEPQRGDVMVFFPPNDDRYFIKRVIGLPGDVIDYRNKVLTINGVQQSQEELVNLKLDPNQRNLYREDLSGVEHKIYRTPRASDARYPVRFPVKVKPGHYFMMGDNRDNSSDSRVWGQVPEDHIVGKAFAIWMHWVDWSSLPSFSRVGLIQ
ncbi:Signal peptidase I [BD1-7 clade bacterium]|uniref:Signal peptidase I n=1 Tax=BD1-7 clade bacterium TaxID=2029982 RepID=A0A5S9QED7_9GAMM|nr:Signal peptidase I [BD1-7 clade bacterium]CAA0115967.1 Signal peptidase I [BD1-7 clade bacterium]